MKALIVEDSPLHQKQIVNVLRSMGHRYDTATNQQDAYRLIDAGRYDYYLVDLQIPIDDQGGESERIQNGEHVISHICNRNGFLGPPVIVVTSHGIDTPALATSTSELGAVGYVTKPLKSTGDTLDKAINKALQVVATRRRQEAKVNAARERAKESERPFRGGDLFFEDGYATLSSVKIITERGRGRAMSILIELARRAPDGYYPHLSADELASRIGVDCDTNGVTSCIKYLRRNFTRHLNDVARVICEQNDVIDHDVRGYFLRDWIECHMFDGDQFEDFEEKGIADEYPNLNHRQVWILGQLRKGLHLERKQMESKFGISAKTARADLRQLIDEKRIETYRQSNSYYYRLRSAKK